MTIHPTAIVDPKARLAAGVEIGPYAVIGPHVEIGAGSSVGAHTVITGHTRIGAGNSIFQHVSLGAAPQDKKYKGEPTRLEIGDRNTIREFCTLNCATVQDAGVTRLGSDNWIMAYVHLAHDCQVGNNTILANSTQLGGHVHIGDYAILGGITAVHQFCHIGAHCITGAGTVVLQDVPPYIMVSGNPAKAYGINSEGLKRRGFDAAQIANIKNAYRIFYRSKLKLAEATEQLKALVPSQPEIKPFVDFLAASERSIIR